MRSKGIIYATLAACVAGAAVVGACATFDEDADVETTGKASLPLTTVGASGTEYRLDAATFAISGPTTTTLESGAEETLEVDLASGSYTITLAQGWQLLATVDGVTAPVEAELVSPNPLPFTIVDETTTDVVFQFEVDGTVIQLGEGTAQISIDVVEASAPAGPCDIYADAGTPCVAAYSMVRALSSGYAGPLYQVRAGSSAENTGTGGITHDIPMTADGFADADAQDAVCAGTICTVSVLYDQSGNGNHLTVAKAGPATAGETAALDDFESIANAGELTVDGHRVYSLYMAPQQGYRLAAVGNGMPLDTEPQGIYMLADGTHYGTACCWEFGNVSTNPFEYHVANSLFFGVGYWGQGDGSGPWFMADFEAGIWAGGSNPGDPGWGGLNDVSPPNPNNPSMQTPFALGFLKTDPSNWSLRMADAQGAAALTTAYAGALPKAMDNQGGIVLGVSSDNSNYSWGTFYEGAIVAGYPADATEQEVTLSVQAAGYGQ